MKLSIPFLTACACVVLTTLVSNAQSKDWTPLPGEDQKIIIATKSTDTNNAGGRFILSNTLSVFESGVTYGLPRPPSDVTALILEEGKPARWSTAPLAEIDKLLGGDGVHEIELQNVASKNNKPIDLDSIDGKKAEELFENLPNDTIQPRDGLWTAELISTEILDCPAQVEGAVRSQNWQPQSTHLNFSVPFKPTDISKEFGKFKWNKTSENRWTSLIVAHKEGPVSFKKSITFGLRSQTEIRYVSKVRMTLPPAAVKVLGKGANCRATVLGRYKRTGS